jgi:hypothetical protein
VPRELRLVGPNLLHEALGVLAAVRRTLVTKYTRCVRTPVICWVRGHRWATIADRGASVTTCSRCGALRHQRSRSVHDMTFLVHTDVAADFSKRPTRGPDDLDPDGE